MKKVEKSVLIEEVSQKLKDAKGVVLVNFAGMGVKPQQELKNRLGAVDAKMIVVKNTLLKLAMETAKIDSKNMDESILTGQTAVVIANGDAIAPISILGKFAKEFEVPQMKFGIVEGSVQDEAALTKIAALPGRDALLGQVLGSLMSGMYQLVGTLNSPMQALVYTLAQKAK